ncbi:hypothetical protein [Solibacillus sp. CAU 1738]|uniref:hypothetical protein n=1 Tax=Solibacillus sp. CAU 1738 TaxID=3140363 RepID=UPI003260A4A3
MKRITLSEIQEDNLKKRHLIYFETYIYPLLVDIYTKEKDNQEFKNFLSYLKSHYKLIAIGSPNDLHRFRDKIKIKFPEIFIKLFGIEGLSEKENSEIIDKDLRNKLLKVFNYDGFCKNINKIDLYRNRSRLDRHNKSGWNAYALIDEIGMKVCPYCEINYILLYKDENGKTRPTLDHFYDKAKHPYFAVSLFNLIPSCYTCNSSFKGSRDFSIETHLHPYLDDIEGKGKFTLVNSDNGKFDIAKLLTCEYSFEFKGVGDVIDKRVENSLTIFHIRELYKEVKTHIDELINQHFIYNEKYIEQLAGLSIFSGEEEIRMILTGKVNIHTGKSIVSDERILSKLMKDVENELGLTYGKM